MRYGVPIQEFWEYYNPKLMEMRQKEYLESVKSKYEVIDFQAWVNGQYTLDALACAFDSKKHKYPQTYRSNKLTEQQQQNVTVQTRRFEDWANVFNMRFANKHNRVE